MNAASWPKTASQPVAPDEAQELFGFLAHEPALLIAVSGGPDSMALLGLLAEWAREPGRPALLAATVDHGLRPDAAAEAGMVAQACARLGVAHDILPWQGNKPATGFQDAARKARYDLLAEAASRHGCRVVVTAHTQDDQAETVLMRMAHGSGPGGLAGMKRRSRRGALEIARPLLGLAKARLVATAQAQGLPFVSDPSNEDPKFERVRWRRRMPGFEAAGLTAERLATLARRLARVDAAIAAQVEALRARLGTQASNGIDAGLLFGEPDEVSLRVLAHLVAEATGDSAPLRLERLEHCHEALRRAAEIRAPLRRTLGGSVLSLDREGRLRLRCEAPRRRGVHPATS